MKLRRMIRNSQDKMSEFTDKKRKDISYKIEDKVFLLMKNIDIIRPLKKLDYKMIESFKIIQETEGSYELNLLELMAKKHSVFHSLLLKRAEKDFLSEQIQQSQLLLIVKNDEQWEVNDILNARKRYG